jgi:hypothetical protein
MLREEKKLDSTIRSSIIRMPKLQVHAKIHNKLHSSHSLDVLVMQFKIGVEHQIHECQLLSV